MGHIHFQREVEDRYAGHYVVDLSEIRAKEPRARTPCRVSQELFDALGDYTNSLPTSPSPGRVYKKNQGWGRLGHTGVHEWDPRLEQHGFTEEKRDDWYVYFVRNGSWVEDQGRRAGERVYGQEHHPFRLVVDDALPAN